MLNKLEQSLFYFLFFAIPFQVRKILYSPGWYFNEWQSVSLYFTDLILLVLFLFWIVSIFKIYNLSLGNVCRFEILQFSSSKKFLNFSISQFLKPDFYLVLFLAAAAISVKNSSDFYVGAFLWLKLVEFALLYFYLKSYAIQRFDFQKILYALIAGGAFQAVIGTIQFLKQGDLGLRWLGESVLKPDMAGVASFFIESGEKVMRAYGTTPHPNILAAYLLLVIFAFYLLFMYSSDNKKQYDVMIYHTVNKFWWVWYPTLLFGLFFTFSRMIIFLWAVGFLARGLLITTKSKFRERFWRSSVFKKRLTDHGGERFYDTMIYHKKLIRIVTVTVLTVIIFSFLYWPEVQSRMILSSGEEAVRLRVFYNKESLGGGLNLFGIGLGDFTPWLMEQNPNLPRHIYQPVHNIYLLLYSEVGIVGFVFFLLFLIFLIRDFVVKTKLKKLYHYSFLLVTLSIFFIGLFDHFLLTIQQGRFMFWLGLTLLAIGDIIIEQVAGLD